MIRLAPVESDETATLDAIIGSKHNPRKQRLQELRPKLLRRYSRYRNRTADFSRIAPARFTEEECGDCLHCYDGDTAALAELKERIRSALPDEHDYFCEWCGIGPWDSYDHYLPKAAFPEFSALGRNLIPCCSKCNQLKGESWRAGERPDILNLYYDDWPEELYLRVDIDYGDGSGPVIRFAIAPDAEISAGERTRIERHYERLDLFRRFTEAAISIIRQLRRAMTKHRFDDEAQAANYLLVEAEAIEEVHGPNHWKAVVARELANTPSFLQSVIQ